MMTTQLNTTCTHPPPTKAMQEACCGVSSLPSWPLPVGIQLVGVCFPFEHLRSRCFERSSEDNRGGMRDDLRHGYGQQQAGPAISEKLHRTHSTAKPSDCAQGSGPAIVPAKALQRPPRHDGWMYDEPCVSVSLGRGDSERESLEDLAANTSFDTQVSSRAYYGTMAY